MATAAELLRARGVNGRPEAKTSPETLAATYGLAKVREACRWADSRRKPACQLVSGLQGGYALAPEPGSEASASHPGEETHAERREALRGRLRRGYLRQIKDHGAETARRLIGVGVSDAEWADLVAEAKRYKRPGEEQGTPAEAEAGAEALAILRQLAGSWRSLA